MITRGGSRRRKNPAYVGNHKEWVTERKSPVCRTAAELRLTRSGGGKKKRWSQPWILNGCHITGRIGGGLGAPGKKRRGGEVW